MERRERLLEAASAEERQRDAVRMAFNNHIMVKVLTASSGCLPKSGKRNVGSYVHFYASTEPNTSIGTHPAPSTVVRAMAMTETVPVQYR